MTLPVMLAPSPSPPLPLPHQSRLVESGDGGWSHPRYILHEPLGQGGMGTVYRARDRLTGTWVALKRVRIRPGSPSGPAVFAPASVTQEETLPPETGMSQLDAYMAEANAGEWATQAAPLVPLPPPHSSRAAGAPRSDTLLSHSPSQQPLALALAQEFRTLASLRHRNIVSVFDYGFDASKQPFFTMELVPTAEPFLQVCRQRDLAGRVTLLLEVLQSLSYLHRRGVLHCDLKPANVLYSEGRIIVLDFGLSTLRSLTATGSNELSGTLHYMAPELFSGRPASEASDLYAFGIMATQVLTGRRPFDADRSELLVTRVLGGELDLSGPELSRPLRQLLERLLLREPQARLADATQAARELAAAAGMTLPPETAQLRESYLQAASFVGREPELAALRGALKRATEGQGSLWLVGGESGVGKSRLLEELRTLALVRGVHVDCGQAITESHAAYQLFRDVLRSVALSLPLSPLEQSTLLPVVPDLPALLGHDIAPPPELEPQAARNRLQTVLCDVLLRSDTPTVLILEDLHWAALESRELLARLLPALAERPLLILASYRDDECPQLAAELPGAKLLPLSRLSPRGMSELVESMLGSIGQRADLVLWLRQQTEGNPFFLVEILRALAEEAGSLANINLRSLQPASLPQGLGTVIKRRLSRLPGWALPGLKQAAIIGRRIDPELMRGFLAAGKLELEPWLAACAEAAVLEVHSEHWQFAHDKLREGVIAELSPKERASLHRQVADAIERTAAPAGEVAAVLAFHLQQADEPQRAYRYAILAGEAAIARGAPRECEEILAQAATLEPRGFPSLLLQVRLRRLRGKAQLALGHIDDCLRTTEEGLGLLGLKLPASTQQLALSLGRGLLTQGVHRLDDGAVFQTRLSRLLDPGLSPDLLREALGLLASHAEVAFYVSSGPRFFYCALAATNLADQLRDEPQQIIGYAALAYNASIMSLPALSVLYLSKADALRQAHRGTFAEFNFLRLRGGLYISQGHFQQSEIDLMQADQIAHDIGDTYSRLVALQQILWCRVFSDALVPTDDVLALFVRLADSEGHRQFAARARVMEAHSLLLSGQPALAQPMLEAALVQIRAARDLTFELHAVQLHARAALRLQQWETVRADTDVLRSIFADSPILNYGVLPAASGLADVSLDLLGRASPLLQASYRHRVEQAFVVLERLAKYHAIARPILLRAQARRLRVQAGSPQRAQAIEPQAQALERKAQALSQSLR